MLAGRFQYVSLSCCFLMCPFYRVFSAAWTWTSLDGCLSSSTVYPVLCFLQLSSPFEVRFQPISILSLTVWILLLLFRTWSVLFPSTWLYVFMGTIMSVSSGYLSGLAMMYAPKWVLRLGCWGVSTMFLFTITFIRRVVEPSKSRVVSMMAGFFLIFGMLW